MDRNRTFLVVVALTLTVLSSVWSQEYFNYGRQWKSWSDPMRSAYMDGFVSGVARTYTAMFDDTPAERREPLRLQVFIMYDRDLIRDVMTNLYSDPANALITHEAMVYVAKAKLDGKDTEELLRRLREKGRGVIFH